MFAPAKAPLDFPPVTIVVEILESVRAVAPLPFPTPFAASARAWKTVLIHDKSAFKLTAAPAKAPLDFATVTIVVHNLKCEQSTLLRFSARASMDLEGFVLRLMGLCYLLGKTTSKYVISVPTNGTA
jgi:hypothetical protein